MSRLYEHCIDPGSHEFAVVQSCFDLHMYFNHDASVRNALRNPSSIKNIRRAIRQLDELVRKMEFLPVIEGVCREPRQADMQKVEEGVSA